MYKPKQSRRAAPPVRQRLAMQTISGADEQSPSVAEERSIARAAAGLRRKVRNDDDVEFETLRLVHGQQSHNFVFLADDLSFLLAHARVVRAVVEVANSIVDGRGSLPRKLARDFDELPDVGHTLAPVLLRHHDDIEVRPANDVLKNLCRCSGISSFDPMLENTL